MKVSTRSLRPPPRVIGVFGGAFDPPHLGHVLLPAYLRAMGAVDRLVIAPCADHPFGKTMTPFETRCTWLRVAMRHYDEFVDVTELEQQLLERHGAPSYTIRLLDAIAHEHPQAQVRLVIGSDITASGETARWHAWDRIEAEYTPIVVPRTGHASESPAALPEISSTQVRALIQAQAWDEVARRVPIGVVELLRRDRAGASTPTVWTIGRGHVSTHVVPWLREGGVKVRSFGGRAVLDGDERLPDDVVPDGVWLLVADKAVPVVAQALVERGQLDPDTPVLHAAGARAAHELLAPLRAAGHPVGSLHPICSLRSERRWPSRLGRATFGIEGDEPARQLALQLVQDQPWLDLQGLDARARLAYHGACALAANHLAVLQRAATDVLVGQHHPVEVAERAIASLLVSALDNLLALGIPAGITGPVVRGDQAAVEGHIDALPGPTGRLYALLSERLAAIVESSARDPQR